MTAKKEKGRDYRMRAIEETPLRIDLFEWSYKDTPSEFFKKMIPAIKYTQKHPAHVNLMVALSYMAGKVEGMEMALELIREREA